MEAIVVDPKKERWNLLLLQRAFPQPHSERFNGITKVNGIKFSA
jgi:hypothetical protein